MDGELNLISPQAGEHRWWGLKRSLLCITLGASGWPVAALLPAWLGYMYVAVLFIWCVMGLWPTFPRPCVVCGRSGRNVVRFPFPRSVPYVRPAWWDLRPERPAIWVCEADAVPYMHMRTRERLADQQNRRPNS